MKKIVLAISVFVISHTCLAGSGTELFKIVKVQKWGGGEIKIYTDKVSINGMEGCTATDKSLAVPANSGEKNSFLSIALAAQARGAELNAWVESCCVAHNSKTSPCISTLTIN